MLNNKIRDCCHLVAAVLAAALMSLAAYAAPPELGIPATGSGQPTSARFFGGATADGGLTYLPAYGPDAPLDILAEIHVEAGHVNSVGNLYVVASTGDVFFQRLPNGAFVQWDGSVAGLMPTAAAIPLAPVEAITLIENLAFGQIGIYEAVIYFFLAYDTTLNPGEIYYSGVPMTVVIDEDAVDPFQLYQDSISQPIVQARCVICHMPGGLASSSNLVYALSNQPGYQQTNYDALVDYILNAPGGSDLILSKPLGDTHGGGAQLAEGSADYQAWAEFVAAVLALAGGDGGGGAAVSLFDGVSPLDNTGTLRKAALLLAGRLPTDSELAAVADDSEESLRAALRGLMDDPGFENFLIEGANDRLLTLAYSRSLFSVVDRYYFPNSRGFVQKPNVAGSDLRYTSEAVALEPLKLISHVVRNERPYTEILTADYLMVNPWSAQLYGSQVQFDDPNDPAEWREGQLTAYFRCTVCTRNGEASYPFYSIPTDYPHAGVLNSPAFLARFPSTSTNRNRARARWAYYFFLGVDIEGLAERATDPDALADENNPTLNNPNCTVCHDIMDPVAGAFQNYGDKGYYRDKRQGLDSLANSYKTDPQGLYQPGDTWYADMLAPGFKDRIAPNADNSLQWLAAEMAADSRFGSGTVGFWFPAVMGREPLPEPENPEDADYAIKAAAYAAEQHFMAQVAEDFVTGAHGYGTFNLKDLLVDLLASEYFRAATTTGLTLEQTLQLEQVGTGRLLSPEQLNRKLQEVAGYTWRYGSFTALTDVYSLVYGGIDSQSITERAQDLTSMMSTVMVTLANEASCAMTAQDFGRPQAQRLLFPYVELDTLPTGGESLIRENIRYLHQRLLGEELSANDPEIDASLSLFTLTRQARIDAGKGPAVSNDSELCLLEGLVNPVTSDPNQTLRSWAALLNYLMRDYRFIHE